MDPRIQPVLFKGQLPLQAPRATAREGTGPPTPKDTRAAQHSEQRVGKGVHLPAPPSPGGRAGGKTTRVLLGSGCGYKYRRREGL